MPPRRAKASKIEIATQAPHATDAPPHPALLSFPLDAIESIGEPLELADRIRLASCCRGLRSRTLSSSRLWGNLRPSLSEKPPAYHASLAAWLATHRSGLRLLHLDAFGARNDMAAVPRLLGSVSGGTLAALELRYVPAGASLQAVGQLRQLTRLSMRHCDAHALPAELGALPLTELDMSSCERLGPGGDAAFAPLAHLGASLTSLKLLYCELPGRIPAPLGMLSALRNLELGVDASDKRAAFSLATSPPPAPDAFAPLACLSALTSLSLRGLGFSALPAELSALYGLQVADFHAMFGLKGDDAGAWGPLSHLTALTALELGSGVRARLPAQLAACTALAELNVSHGWGLDRDDAPQEAWGPLSHLTALTKLVGLCGRGAMSQLPDSLRELCATGSLSVSSQADLASFSRLTALTRLDLSSSPLPLFPAALSACGALRELLLDQASFSELPETAFQPLTHLTALTRLSLSNAQLATVPPALAAATALVDLDLGGSKWAPHYGPGGMIVHQELGHLSRLAPLTRLQRLVLWNTGTRRLPPQLSTLRNLSWLALSQCDAMGQGGDGAFEPLRHMTAMRELNLENTGLRAVPSQLSALAALSTLDLTSNPGLARAGPSAWRPLLSLRNLHKLDLSLCGIRSPPAALAQLRAAGVELKIGYATEYEMYADM